jgi:prefoldin subunit 5
MAIVSRADLKARIAELEKQVAALQGQVSNLQAKVASLESEKAVLASANSDLQVQLDAEKLNVTALRAQIADKDAQIAALNAKVAELQQKIDDLTNPNEPPPSGTTLMGVTVTGGVRKNLPDLHDNVQVSRVFAAGATVWSNEPQHKAFPNSKWACSNSYALSEANLPKMLATIPDADKKKIIAWADGHELEHPDKNLNPADVKARTKRTAPVIRAAGLKSAWCMMGYSLRNDDWLNWVDPHDVDYLFFDKYNSANKQDPPGYTDPADMVAKAVAASKQFGKPWGFWETGTNNFGDQAKRVAWTKALRAEMVRQGAVTAIWFDRPSTSGSDWDATMDRSTAEAWLL